MQNTPLSLLRSLKADGYERQAALEKLILQDVIGDDAVSVVTSELGKGRTFIPLQLSKFVLRVGSDSLYSAAKNIIFTDPWAILELHRQGFNDPEIETSLCETLFDVAHDNGQPLRRYIVESLRDQGSSAATPVLKSILLDLLPTADVKRVFADALKQIGTVDIAGLLELTETRSLRLFIVLIDSALLAIQQRSNSTGNHPLESSQQSCVPAGNGKTDPPPDEVIERVVSHQNKAWEYLGRDNETALNRARKAVESLCKDVYRLKGLEKNNKPAKELARKFEDLITTLDKNGLPTLMSLAIKSIQGHGNFGSHDQDDEISVLSDVHVRPVLMQLDAVVEWFKGFRLSSLANLPNNAGAPLADGQGDPT